MIYNQFIFFVLIAVIVNIAKSEECLQDQICVPIDHCSTINKRLYEPNLNEAEKEELKKIKCGLIDNKVHVCCKSSLPKPGECGSIHVEEKITASRVSSLGQFPWIVLIDIWKKENNKAEITSKCVGSIINDRYILTSAHCVKFFSFTNYKEETQTIVKVKLGEWNTETNPDEENGFIGDPVIEAEVEQIITHKDYRLFQKYHDIALLRLKEKIEYTKLIKSICLPRKEQIYDEDLIVIGWRNNEDYRIGLEKLQKFSKFNLVDNKSCNEKYPNFEIESTQLCANGDTCISGPLFGINSGEIPFYYYLAGVQSFGVSPCGKEGHPDVFSDIRKYIDWIEQNIIH